MPQLFLFGDSITWGSWDPVGGGWAQRLRSEIDRYQAGRSDFWCPTYNLGIPGETAGGIAKRIGNEMDVRLAAGEEPIVLIAVGINDSSSFSAQGSLSIGNYHRNLEDSISKAISRTKKVGVIGLFPTDESVLTPVSWDSSRSYTLARAEEFNSECISVCGQKGVPCLNVWKQLKTADVRTLLYDGLHPNSLGHQWMHEAIRKFLRESELLTVPFPV